MKEVKAYEIFVEDREGNTIWVDEDGDPTDESNPKKEALSVVIESKTLNAAIKEFKRMFPSFDVGEFIELKIIK